jgi:hypothetical protein
MGNVEEFNAHAQEASGIEAVPFVFNNAGSMVADFRTMNSRLANRESVISTLVNAAIRYGYSTMSLDLEPSCWATDTYTDCEFPTMTDAVAYQSFINELSDKLHALQPSVSLSLASASYPPANCEGGYPQFARCDEKYAENCASGDLDISTCNCCAFTTWFNASLVRSSYIPILYIHTFLYLLSLSFHRQFGPVSCTFNLTLLLPYSYPTLTLLLPSSYSPQVCASKADTIVNMDTYAAAPFNQSYFLDAMTWYTDRGCEADRLAVGLLTSESTTEEDTTKLFSSIAAFGTR